jgi:beta-phosphoglucomutase-like phosphatase (HAD superfamily)
MKKNRIVTKREAGKQLAKLSTEFALIHNPHYIHPQYELYPLAPKITSTRKKLMGLVMDMDGTTTTTEELCIHSLEHMVRQITGRINRDSWIGLDHAKDYPHIIGNSTTKHVEYLIKKYRPYIRHEKLTKSFFFSVLRTLTAGKDEGRKRDIRNNLTSFGCTEIPHDPKFLNLNPDAADGQLRKLANEFAVEYGSSIALNNFNELVRVGIDIYYQRYHEILAAVARGEGTTLSTELLGDPSKHLIEPMPGIGIFLAMTKGILGEEAGTLTEILIDHYRTRTGDSSDIDTIKVGRSLQKLGIKYRNNPLKLAVVTSSIFYEADIVMKEVFKVIREEIASWQVSDKMRVRLLDYFADYRKMYDSFVTASDTNEIRLKPHRDLYSIALQQLNIPKKDFDKVAGFEDSESGTIAIRAAGIGLCIAVPFAQTRGHDFKAASFVAEGGVAEVLLKWAGAWGRGA